MCTKRGGSENHLKLRFVFPHVVAAVKGLTGGMKDDAMCDEFNGDDAADAGAPEIAVESEAGLNEIAAGPGGVFALERQGHCAAVAKTPNP
jgi:hypothetical protein